MNELIHIGDNNGKKVVSARELYEKLGYNKAVWSRWFKKNITGNQFAIENEDWVGFNTMLSGNETQDFALSIDFAKKLSMMARTEQGEKMRQYFIRIEKELQTIVKPLSMFDMMEYSIKQLREQSERVDAIESKVLAIEARTTTNSDYVTIMGYSVINKINTTLKMAATIGRKAAKICRDKGIPMDEIPDPRFGRVRLYPKMILDQVFSEAI